MPEDNHRITHRYRYGIGEWYGKSFVRLSAEERRELAQMQMSRHAKVEMPCPARSSLEATVLCSKAGGICSIRLFDQVRDGDSVHVHPAEPSQLASTCPHRFKEASLVYDWVGETLLGTHTPYVVSEVGFLERVSVSDDLEPHKPAKEDVGRIDNVLVAPHTNVMQWCALEIQAVYFSGEGMSHEYRMLSEWTQSGIPFPSRVRRPDFRSSGPKRLMPQLQTKVPALRRWGKKMAVVVDEAFFESLGPMDNVRHISNSDIVWFVVAYDESAGEVRLSRGSVHCTTLERAVEGLTGGQPISLEAFEARIMTKLPIRPTNTDHG